MKNILYSITIFFFIFSAKAESKPDAMTFFKNQQQSKEKSFYFNQYEHLISGLAAFTIGNIGYLTTKSSVLKVTYTGIQTIGIINIGQGIYKLNTGSFEESFYQKLSKKSAKESFSKEQVASTVIDVFAKELRAKRLSIFYSSSFLAAQYAVNALVYDSPDRLKNIYIFLSGINAIVATYMALNKSDYEAFKYGDGLDLSPFAYNTGDGGEWGLNLSYSW
jgi:hypothetical protein